MAIAISQQPRFVTVDRELGRSRQRASVDNRFRNL
jgi:hypothetical protein